MAFNGSGTFVRLYNWVTDRDAAVAITSARMDDEMDGFATGLSTCIARDGQTTTTAAIPFAGGAVKLADGSVTAPSVSFISDTNTGAYWIAADNFALATGGVKILELDGDAASAATGLKITNAAAASGVDLSVISSGTNENLTINAKGSGTITLNSTGTGNVITSRAFVPAANDGAALGVSGTAFADLFLASGGVINWNAGDVTATHSANALAFAGASSGYSFDAVVLPATTDGAALGSASVMWSDLFLASGGVINWDNGDVTATHSANTLAFAGASSGYTFDAAPLPSANDGAALGASGTAWADLFLASGGVINFNAGVVTLTQSASALTMGGSSTLPFVAPAYRSVNVATIADDAATTVTIPGNATNNGAFILVSTNGSPGATVPVGIIYARTKGASVAPVTIAWNDATNVAYTTGTLAGTTGTDGKLTFSVNNDGLLYVENRLGASKAYAFTILGVSS